MLVLLAVDNTLTSETEYRMQNEQLYVVVKQTMYNSHPPPPHVRQLFLCGGAVRGGAHDEGRDTERVSLSGSVVLPSHCPAVPITRLRLGGQRFPWRGTVVWTAGN